MQRTYKLMRQLLVVVALLVVSTGCSNTESTIEKTTKNEVLKLPKPQQLQELPFESVYSR